MAQIKDFLYQKTIVKTPIIIDIYTYARKYSKKVSQSQSVLVCRLPARSSLFIPSQSCKKRSVENHIFQG